MKTIARDVLVPLPNGASVPLGQVASVRLVQGPASIRTENAQLAAYIYVDARDRATKSTFIDRFPNTNAAHNAGCTASSVFCEPMSAWSNSVAAGGHRLASRQSADPQKTALQTKAEE
jgi:hypothetical protein